MTPSFAILLALAISADDPPAVRLTAGQEFVYRGRYSEESGGDRRGYDLEARAFVLQASASSAEVAFLTILRGSGTADGAGSARGELATVDIHGRVALHSSGQSPQVPVIGPPSLEAAGFIELPAQPINGPWDVADGSRPPREWRCAGDDLSLGIRCLKLIGEQESAEWRRPTAEAPGWRRIDTVWVSAASGVVQRLERTTEKRGGTGRAGYLSHLEYERAESSTRQLTADLRREIGEIAEVNRRLTGLAPLSGRPPNSGQFAAVAERIDRFVADQPATPYRPALLALRARAEAGARGETPPPADLPDPPSQPPAVGQAAPDFLTSDLVTGAPVRLFRWRGRPVALLFVRPNSTAAGTTLRLAADLQSRYADRLRIAVLVVTDEERARPAWRDFNVPLLAGRDAAKVYELTVPSRVIVLDADGVVRFLGDAGPGVIDAVQRVVAPVSGN